MATGWSDLSPLGQAGIITQGFGAIQGMFAAGAKANFEKYKAKSAALNYQHQKDMALFNADMKESQAQHLAKTFNKRYQILTMQQGSRKSKRRVSLAARGGQAGVGSSKDVEVSQEILDTIDKLTMNSNKARAVSNKRLEAVGLAIQGDQYGLSAGNMFATASSISPLMNMSSSLLTSGSNILNSLPPSMLRA